MLMTDNLIKVYLKLGYSDMRKSINGLSIIVSDELDKDPFSGHLFAFCNRSRKIIKVLYWDRNGFCLWYKRLDKGVFRWPVKEADLLELNTYEFRWLLDGLSPKQPKAHPALNYSCVY